MKIMTVAVMLIASMLASNSLMAGHDDGDHDSQGGPHPGMRGPAGEFGMFGMPDPERMVRHISRMLELNDTTTQQLTNVVLAAKPELLALREKARANREAIGATDTTASDYGVTIHALAVESGQIATETTLLVSQLRLDIHSKLTEEQRQALSASIGRMRHHREGKRRAHSGETEHQ